MMQMQQNKNPRLYGICSKNSNRKDSQMWGKNCFNSSFPAALACHMRDQKNQAVYVCVQPKGREVQIENQLIDIDKVFGALPSTSNSELFFSFETKFQPYEKYDFRKGDDLDSADLVIKHNKNWLRPLQIKLTVVPDNGTSGRPPDEWSPELVLRPADMSSCALGIFDSISNRKEEVIKLFDDICFNAKWDALPDNPNKKRQFIEPVQTFIRRYCSEQKPYLLQPIWKTKGKQPFLDESNAIDLFVWSDFALVLACLIKAGDGGVGKTTRAFRAIARFVRAQHELAVRQNTDLKVIYRQMDFGWQTDKAAAFSGLEMRTFLTSPHRANPRFSPEVLRNIILNNGHRELSPERRFDQTVYFTAEKIFNE